MFPLAEPVEHYNVAINTSAHSGLGTISVIFAAFGAIIVGLALRIHRSVSESL